MESVSDSEESKAYLPLGVRSTTMAIGIVPSVCFTSIAGPSSAVVVVLHYAGKTGHTKAR